MHTPPDGADSADLKMPRVEVLRSRKTQLHKKPLNALSPALELELPGKALRATVFRKVDTQATGTLTVEEARAAVMEIWPSFDGQCGFIPAYRAAMQDATAGVIGRKQFRRMLKYVVYFSNHWVTFEDIAHNSEDSGVLSEKEFRTAARRLGIKGTRARPVAHHFADLATAQTGKRGVKLGKKVSFDT